MSSESPRLVGAVLAGGAGERMGRDKASLELPHGRTFGAAVAMTLSSLCDEVVQLGASAAPIVVDGGPLALIPDVIGGKGPLDGVTALLESGRGQRYVVAACDAPLLPAEVLAVLLEAGGPAASFSRDGGGRHPLPCVLDAALAPLARRRLEAGARGLGRFLDEAGALTLELNVDEELLRGANTPDELEALYARTRSRVE